MSLRLLCLLANRLITSLLITLYIYYEKEDIEEFLKDKKIRFINYQDWEKINAAEIKRGEFVGKPREKFTTISEMLACVGK
jgi:hypothetical protein